MQTQSEPFDEGRWMEKKETEHETKTGGCC